MDKQKSYEIGETTYIQRPLVLGQLAQLVQIIPDSADITGIKGPNDIIEFLGDALADAMAIALCPEGTDSADKDLESIKTELKLTMDLPTTMEVIEDFFGFNRVSSLVERATILMGTMGGPDSESGSRSGSASSPTETSPSGS